MLTIDPVAGDAACLGVCDRTLGRVTAQLAELADWRQGAASLRFWQREQIGGVVADPLVRAARQADVSAAIPAE